MKIAIDVNSMLGGHAIRGIGRNTRELISHVNKILIGNSEGILLEPVDFSTANLAKYDILHYTSFHPFFRSFALHPGKKVVVTIHDLIPLLFPKNYPPGIKGSINYLVQKQLLRKVDAIITISNTSKKDILRFLGVDPSKVHVTYLATTPDFVNLRSKKQLLQKVSKKFNLPNKFVLYVGDVNHNKNVITLIEACKIANQQLVIVGKNASDIEVQLGSVSNLKGPRDYLRFLFNQTHPEIAHYKLILDLINKNDVIRTGFVSDHELAAIYNLASVYVQPSFYEGFGLQVLEAMACATPVVVSRTNALTEIAAGAALVAESHNAHDMAKKISVAITDSDIRSELIRKGTLRVKQFSWKSNAFDTIEVYKKISK